MLPSHYLALPTESRGRSVGGDIVLAPIHGDFGSLIAHFIRRDISEGKRSKERCQTVLSASFSMRKQRYTAARPSPGDAAFNLGVWKNICQPVGNVSRSADPKRVVKLVVNSCSFITDRGISLCPIRATVADIIFALYTRGTV